MSALPKRKLPPNTTLKRDTAHWNPKNTTLVIVCEGKNTEPDYLCAFADDHQFLPDHLRIIAGAGTPEKIVERAVDEKNKLTKKRDQSMVYEIWAVFDRDEHPYIAQARNRAQVSGIHVAYSNPCIELWALYHFVDHNAELDRHSVQKLLKKHMNYDPDSDKKFAYEPMKKNYQTACQHAENGLNKREAEGDPHGNPSTTLHYLTKRIIELAQDKTTP
ncbi:RloB family protein [Candidatus Magnetaquicoccus inordinatus]|uniref:RloB family protein n=1 Tax=Candidatus Magnetaquicoccus inordinatus TaxID=2496818 RepID=UPI00102B5A67|nr:RloB family protein [Candidatus Magnetaquicoccus inordinatus]